MGLSETAVLYGILGLVVASAMSLQSTGSKAWRLPLFLAWTILWPFFAPSLFGGALDRTSPVRRARSRPDGSDPRIAVAQEQLLSALEGVDGVAKEVLSLELARIQKLVAALAAMEGRLHEMDALLADPELDLDRADAALREIEARAPVQDDPRLQSLHARRRNIEQLRQMRERTSQDLERALLKMEEMRSQVLLLRFANRPETELIELVKEIAASVEGLAEGMMASA